MPCKANAKYADKKIAQMNFVQSHYISGFPQGMENWEMLGEKNIVRENSGNLFFNQKSSNLFQVTILPIKSHLLS